MLTRCSVTRGILRLPANMRELILYEDYSREEVHDIFDPESTFTPQAGTWGLQGIVELPNRAGDYVFCDIRPKASGP
jgi:hypothetical protein